MQLKLFIATFILSSLAAANPLNPVRRQSSPSNQCNTGSLQCCTSVQSSDTTAVSVILALLGVVLGGVPAQVGLQCSPITVVGVSGTSCSEQPVCCTDNAFNGVIALGCTPINLNL